MCESQKTMKVEGNVSQVFDTKYFGAFMLNCKKKKEKKQIHQTGKKCVEYI